MTKKLALPGFFLTTLFAIGVSVAPAQSPFGGIAPPEAINEVNSIGSPSPVNPFAGGGAPGGGGGAPANSPFGAPGGGAPAGGGGGSPFGGPAPGAGGGGSPFGAPAGGGGGGPAPGVSQGFESFGNNPNQNNNQPVIPPVPQTTRVLTGTRRYCAVTGRLIEDARWQEVWNTVAAKNYYDDGKTGGDAVAGDNYFTRIEEYQNEMSPFAFRMFIMNRNLVETALDRDPLVFFQLTAMTSDPDSSLPNYFDKERDQDARIEEWNNTFLRPYRVNPEDPTSEIYPVYVPPPPTAPDVPSPPGFTVPAGIPMSADGQGEGTPAGGPGGGRGDGFDDWLASGGGLNPGAPQGVTGTPQNSAASSNYFSTTAR